MEITTGQFLPVVCGFTDDIFGLPVTTQSMGVNTFLLYNILTFQSQQIRHRNSEIRNQNPIFAHARKNPHS
jgi:hypothetical protein